MALFSLPVEARHKKEEAGVGLRPRGSGDPPVHQEAVSKAFFSSYGLIKDVTFLTKHKKRFVIIYSRIA